MSFLLIKTFCGFLVLKHTLWQKLENPELEIKNFLQQKTCVGNKHNYQKTAYIKTKYFNKIKTMHMHNMNTRK